MARGNDFGIRLEGVRELTRALAKVDKGLAKGIAQENKAIGQLIISRLSPQPLNVGTGAGARPRAIASRNMVAIRAGGAHRKKVPVQVWGTRGTRKGPRPHIVKAGLDAMPEIKRRFIDAITNAVRASGLAR